MYNNVINIDASYSPKLFKRQSSNSNENGRLSISCPSCTCHGEYCMGKY